MSLLADPRLAGCRRLFLRDWRVDARIGVYSAERAAAQQLLLNIDLFVDLATSTPLRDELAEIFDYDRVRAIVQGRLARGHINLQETLVDDLVDALLAEPGVVAARVSSEKTGIYAEMGGIGVEVLRFRGAP
jgi:dihydroneopterin aldolase